MVKVHFLGIAGSGASAAAAIAKGLGFEVSGCDLSLEGHSPEHLKNIDILAITPAILSLDPNNAELKEANKKGIKMLTWQEFMGKFLQKDKLVIAVCGTHGKSTTTAMIGLMLEDAGLDPTVELGAIVPRWGTNYRIPTHRHSERSEESPIFVTEADEFNNNFLSIQPDITVITNIEMDHPEYFEDFNSYKKSFNKFIKQSKKVIDKPNSKLINFPLIVPGEFNILNASLAYQVGLLLGINPQKIKQSLASYSGIGRRFEYLGKYKGAQIYTDFGHHPTEIKTTMKAAREKFPESKIWLIFEPHMFTRTKFLFDDFVKVFKEIPIDKIIITDIYQSREIDKGLVTSQQLANAANVIYIPKTKLKNALDDAGKNDVVFFMGAGDIDKLASKLIA